MLKKSLFGLVFIFLCVFSSSAGAVSINLTSGATGGVNGTQFAVTIGIDTQGVGISAYSISLAYDTTELEYGPGSAQELKPAGFDGNFNVGVLPGNATGAPYPFNLVPPDPQHQGVIGTWEASNLFAPPVSGIFDIGSLSFKIIGQGTADGNDILAGLFDAGVDGILDANNSLISHQLITFGHVDVNANAVVPEPASLLLLGTGLVGLISIGRRAKKGR